MDLEQFNALASLVRLARIADHSALVKLNQATDDWKHANQVLTDRLKVFDEFVASSKAEAISIVKED